MAILEYQTIDTNTIKACPEQSILTLKIAPNEELNRFNLKLSLLNIETDLLGELQKGTILSDKPEHPEYNSGWIWNTSPASISYEWISCALGNKYSLSSIEIRAKNPDPNIYARLKVSNGYSWYQIPPFEKIAINKKTILTEVIADKVLLEFYTCSDNIETKAPLAVSSIIINTKYYPADLKFKLNNTEIPIQRDGNFYTAQNLVKIINDYREQNNMPEIVPLMLSSSIQGRVKISYTLKTLFIKREQDVQKRIAQLPSSPSSCPEQGSIISSFLLEEGTLEEIEFTLKTKFQQQKALYGTDKALDYCKTKDYHFCSKDYGFAQIFKHITEPSILVGVDLFIVPLTETISGALTLQKDYKKRPLEGEKFIAKLPIKIDSEVNRSFRPEWFYFELPNPIVIGTDDVTCIMSIEKGELLWAVNNNRSFYKKGSNSWIECEQIDLNYSGIRFHVRSDKEITSKVMLYLQNNNVTKGPLLLELKPDDSGKYNTNNIENYNKFDILVSTEFGGSAEVDQITILYNPAL